MATDFNVKAPAEHWRAIRPATVLAALLGLILAFFVPAAPSVAAPTLGEQAAAYARNHLVGKPYDGSGRTTLGFNCSGGTYLAWSSVAPGYVNPGSSESQYGGAGERLYIGRGNSTDGTGLIPGDLLFWSTTGNVSDIYHVAMYLGGGQILQAASNKVSWISSVNNDRATRMPYALRPTGPASKPPAVENLNVSLSQGALQVTGTVIDPDSPESRVDLQVEDRWYPSGNMSREFESGRSMVGGEFEILSELRAGGTHDIILRARDVETGNYVQMQFPIRIGIGKGLDANSPVTLGELSEFIHRSSGSPPIGAAEFNGTPFGVAMNWMKSVGALAPVGGSTVTAAAVTRAQAAQMMYIAAGSPSVSLPSSPTFSDVGTGHAAYRAVEWLAAKGLRDALGLSSSAGLSPSSYATRGNVVAMLHLVAGAPTVAPPEGRALWDVSPDDDIFEAAMWALDEGVLWEPFYDVGAGAPFGSEIRWIAESGITTGYDDNTYRPDSAVSRQAMAAFIYRLAGEPAFTPPATATFFDVQPGAAFHLQIEWLASTGLATGYPDGGYHPSASVSRQAMAAFLARLAGADTEGMVPAFSDVSPSHPLGAEIAWLASTGITGGYSDGTFRPGAAVSRRAMAAFLYRYEMLPVG